MNLYEKKVKLYSVIIFIGSLFLQLLTISAIAYEIPIALSENIEKQFREFITVLGDMKEISNGKFSYYEKSPVNLMEVLELFPVQKFKALIVTSSELENIQDEYESKYIVEDGRKLGIEFYIIGRQAKNLLDIKSPKVIHPQEASIMNFYRDIFTACTYERGLAPKHWPRRIYKREDLNDENLEKCDILILKYLIDINRKIGRELLYNIRCVTKFPSIPIHYCDPLKPKDKDDFKLCLEEFYKAHTDKLKYSFKECSNLERFTKIFGVNEKYLLRRLSKNWCVQIVEKEEMVRIIYPAQYEKNIKMFWRLLYKRLNTISWMHARDKDNEQLKSLKEIYSKAVFLITSKMRGIIALADIDYEAAKYEYELTDDLIGLRALQEKLAEKKHLDDSELVCIKNLNELFQNYFDRRVLPKERVDLNLLRAKLMVTRLQFLLHQHYYNLGSNFIEKSNQHLNNAKEKLHSLRHDIESVKTKKGFDYPNLRKTEKFHNIIEQYEKLKPILNIS